MTTFSVVRFEGIDWTRYSKTLGYSKEFNLQFRPQSKGQRESSLFVYGYQQNSCCRTPFSKQDWKFEKQSLCTISLESCKFHGEAMKHKKCAYSTFIKSY